ncbi:hypothetical protein M0802_016928 [Mischocyttarus mexicanus]|nr:hypothetical protein M0802_016928 [Mischocyttarus mexicanus]
MKMKSYLSVRL